MSLSRNGGGNIKKSDRLQTLLGFMRKGSWCDSLVIASHTASLAIHSDIQDLRRNGYLIERKYCGLNGNGRQINKYRLIGRAK